MIYFCLWFLNNRRVRGVMLGPLYVEYRSLVNFLFNPWARFLLLEQKPVLHHEFSRKVETMYSVSLSGWKSLLRWSLRLDTWTATTVQKITLKLKIFTPILTITYLMLSCPRHYHLTKSEVIEFPAKIIIQKPRLTQGQSLPFLP